MNAMLHFVAVLIFFVFIVAIWSVIRATGKDSCPDCDHDAEEHGCHCYHQGCCCQMTYEEVMGMAESENE